MVVCEEIDGRIKSQAAGIAHPIAFFTAMDGNAVCPFWPQVRLSPMAIFDRLAFACPRTPAGARSAADPSERGQVTSDTR